MGQSERKLRIAMIGAGAISKFHLTAWRSLGSVELVAVCDVDPERARQRADEFSVPSAFGSLEELLEVAKPDALDIATPISTHATILRLAAAHGIDCLCQKPLTEDLASSEAIAAELSSRIRLMVNENRRYMPPFATAREWIAAGRIGKVHQGIMTAFRGDYLMELDGFHRRSRTAPESAGSPRRYINEMLIHQIDVLRALLGPLKAIAARTLPTDQDLRGDTLGTLLLETFEGAPVLVAGSGVAKGYPRRRFNDRLEIMGSRGSVIWSQEDSVLRLLGDEQQEVRFGVGETGYAALYQSCFDAAAQLFRDGLINGTPFESDVRDNLETLRIVEDAYRLSGSAGTRA